MFLLPRTRHRTTRQGADRGVLMHDLSSGVPGGGSAITVAIL